MTKKQKIASVLASILLAICLVPMTAFAASTRGPEDLEEGYATYRNPEEAEQMRQRWRDGEITKLEWQQYAYDNFISVYPGKKPDVSDGTYGKPGVDYATDRVVIVIEMGSDPDEVIAALDSMESVTLPDGSSGRDAITEYGIMHDYTVALNANEGFSVQGAIDELWECPHIAYVEPDGLFYEQDPAQDSPTAAWPDGRYVIDEEKDGLPGIGYDADSVAAYLTVDVTPQEAVKTLSTLLTVTVSDSQASQIGESSIRAQSVVRLDVRYGYNVQEALDELYKCPVVAYASPNRLYYIPEDMPPCNWGRLSGRDRYQTSARVCASAFDSAQTVIITSGQNYPDALAAAPLAGLYDAPILIVPAKGTLPLPIAREIVRLGATNAIVIGGTSAVSDDMKSQVELVTGKAGRIAGADRIDTCLRVLENFGSKRDKTAIIVNGYNYPDALSIASYAYAAKMPIFLTQKDGTLRSDEIAAIKAARFSDILLVGGPSVVSERTVSLLGMEDVGREGEDLYRQHNKRLAGSSRYGTNASVVSWELEGRANITIGSYLEPVVNMSVNTVYVASGKGYADALSAAAAAGHIGGTLLLIDGSEQGLQPAQVLSEYGPATRGYIVGGGAALSADTMRAFWNASSAVS